MKRLFLAFAMLCAIEAQASIVRVTISAELNFMPEIFDGNPYFQLGDSVSYIVDLNEELGMPEPIRSGNFLSSSTAVLNFSGEIGTFLLRGNGGIASIQDREFDPFLGSSDTFRFSNFETESINHFLSRSGEVNGLRLFVADYFINALSANFVDTADLTEETLQIWLFSAGPSSSLSFAFEDDLTGQLYQVGAGINSVSVQVIPIPAAMWLFLSAVGGLLGIRKFA